MSDSFDAGARGTLDGEPAPDPQRGFGIVHRADCTAPTIINALPMATMTGRGPIEVIADGSGGEVFRCMVCGAREQEQEAPPSPRPGPQPMTSRQQVEQKQRELADLGLPYGERPVAKALGVSRSAVRYALGKDRR